MYSTLEVLYAGLTMECHVLDGKKEGNWTESRAYLSGWLQSVTFHIIVAVHAAVFVPVQLKY